MSVSASSVEDDVSDVDNDDNNVDLGEVGDVVDNLLGGSAVASDATSNDASDITKATFASIENGATSAMTKQVLMKTSSLHEAVLDFRIVAKKGSSIPIIGVVATVVGSATTLVTFLCLLFCAAF
jgi:hypothetical protein